MSESPSTRAPRTPRYVALALALALAAWLALPASVTRHDSPRPKITHVATPSVGLRAAQGNYLVSLIEGDGIGPEIAVSVKDIFAAAKVLGPLRPPEAARPS